MNLVLYQAPDGTIKTIMHDKDSDRWTEEFNIPGSAATGTPIAGFSTDEALIVSFFGQDNEIHAHTRDFESGDWTGKYGSNPSLALVNLTFNRQDYP